MAASAPSAMYVNMNTGAVQAGLPPFRNALINGDMRINQRATSTNLASLSTVASAFPGSWVTDRWNILRGSYAAGGVMGQGTALTTADLPFSDVGIKTFARLGRLSGNTSTASIELQYSMESQDCYRFVGKTVTLSFYYRTGTNFSGTNLITRVYTGTGTDQGLRGDFTGQIIQETTYPITANWVRVYYTVTLSASLNQIGLMFRYNPVGTAGANDYFDITGVQLELGSVATPFEVRPYPVELQMCLRYCYVLSNIGYASQPSMRIGFGLAGSATRAEIQIPHIVSMRTLPGLSTSGNFLLSDTQNGFPPTSISIYTICSSINSTNLIILVSSGLTAYRSYYFEISSSGTVILSAEI